MQFNSLHFLLFLPTVVVFYFALPYRVRWILLLVASYYFYAAWNPGYLLLIIFSTIVDYFIAIRLGRDISKRRKMKYLWGSLLANLGLLFVFKYYNFFTDSLNHIFGFLSMPVEVPYSQLLLPVGISFYTFQTLSYTIDVYRGDREPIKHFGIFAVYVSFFPQLVAGPIERSTTFLPQLMEKKKFSYDQLRYGVALILWGLFKKVVIADRLAMFVNVVYENPANFSGEHLILATVFFAIQIYCDFSGYSDVAIGSAAIMGYKLMTNFKNPYFALSIGEFWQRWHISLSTWFRDYVYIPTGGNRNGRFKQVRNIMITFLVSGIWHGANWTFFVWGGLHGGLYALSLLTYEYRCKFNKFIGLNKWPQLHNCLRWVLTMMCVLVSWVFFRAKDIKEAVHIITGFLNIHLANGIHFGIDWEKRHLLIGLCGICVLFFVDYLNRDNRFFKSISSQPAWFRWSFYYGACLTALFLGTTGVVEFIYFQF